MLIHSDTLTASDVHTFAADAGVKVIRADRKGSRSRKAKLDVILEGSSKHWRMGGGGPTATWDEWGEFLHRVFDADPNATTSVYPGKDAFNAATDYRYEGPYTPCDHSFRYAYEGCFTCEHCGTSIYR